ncbi:NAD(P)-dependent oxidoreductase [Helicobacter sp. MIT 11-5569]|uniref:SDR family oxidoreductase n=1 Tax=Helicobacter sp. MIT 11-5569 TaxID=1548151 RepID=UPI00051FBE5E|nr:NAD(P)-dependent oxidoreductase [Helicobacter sp. MIT 11-5569]TLD83303.1 NAD(P)-dependent oxidoreductase [Helicobacter sp. MIT 11-5569]
MKIAVLAASGRVGKLITNEALSKGYVVSAFVRDSKKLTPKPNLSIIQKDIFSLNANDLQGFNVIIDCFGEWKELSLHKKHIQHLVKILAGNKAKFLVVGGAGSLYMDKTHTTRLMDTPNFPAEYMGVANATAEVLGVLRKVSDINWVYVCPPAEFVFDAPKSGKYKIIGEEFEVNNKGESKASYADYASAMLEIARDSQYSKQRVGVIGL